MDLHKTQIKSKRETHGQCPQQACYTTILREQYPRTIIDRKGQPIIPFIDPSFGFGQAYVETVYQGTSTMVTHYYQSNVCERRS